MPRFELVPSPSLASASTTARTRPGESVMTAASARTIEPRTYAAGRPLDADR
ncbi:hypothetical protein WME79_19925 [Sorangium sp. So ce726]|uniref:hypothetical protein n=1 Tax=Sorangium sp. So ce726 TaxID=3133319 RepID=UPI003F638955